MIRRSASSRSIQLRAALGALASLSLACVSPSTVLAQDGDAVIELSTSSEQAKAHFWAGLEDAHNLYLPGAVRHLDEAVEADPDWGIAHVMRAQFAAMPNSQRLEDISRGIAAMGEATGDELLMASAILAGRTGNSPKASRMIATLRRNNPDDSYAAFWAARTAGARGSQMDPEVMWESVIEDFPEYAASYNALAYHRWGTNDQSGALEAVRDYLRLAPDHPNPHDSYAEILQGMGHYADALTHYGHAAARADDYTAAHTGMAETYVLMGEYEQAAAHMERAAEMSAGVAQANFLRGAANAYMLGGDRSEAMDALTAAAEAAPNDGARQVAYLQMALTAGLMGEGGDVQVHLDQAAGLGDDTPLFHGMSALAHAAAGHNDEADAAAGAMGDVNAFWASMGEVAKGLALVNDGDAAAAMNALSGADVTDPMVQAVMTLALDDLDRDAEAEALRSNVLNRRMLNLTNPFVGASRYLVGEH